MKMQMTAIKTRSRISTQGKVDEQLMKSGLVVVGLVSFSIGVWALVCLASGVIASGGPLALLANWVRAITG